MLAIVLAWVATGSGSAARPGIAYVTGGPGAAGDVWLAGADGSHGRRLGNGTKPLLAPNGLTVAASLRGLHGSAFALYSAGGSTPRWYFDAASVTAHAWAWSRDSRFLAVVLASTDPVSDAASGLAVIDTRSSSSKIITRGPIYGASFAPDGSGRIAWAAATRSTLSAPVNIYTAAADGSGRVTVTHDGRSLNPVWGRDGIAFDHERLRTTAAPAYQIWLMQPDGSRRRQVTHVPVPVLFDGLVPSAFSDDGSQLLAEYEGQDTNQAWVIDVHSHSARPVGVAGHSVTGGGISHDGRSILIDRGGFLQAPDLGVVESLAIAGGSARVLVARGSEPSWNL